MDKWQVVEITGFHDPNDTSITYAATEVYKITSLRPLPGRKMEVHGDRWDEALQKYRRTKPLIIGEGVPSAVSIEFADED